MAIDGIKWNASARIDKYSPEDVEEITRLLGREPKADDFKRLGADPYAVTEVQGNILVGGGLAFLTAALIGGTYDPLTAARSFVGVGSDSGTAAATSQTDLIGASKYYNDFDSNPTRTTTTVTNDTIQGVSTFGSGVAEHAWNEWAWFTTTTGTITPGTSLSGVSTGTETMWNRKVASMGTKGSGASWVFTTTVAFS
jgi:hypothetical protein